MKKVSDLKEKIESGEIQIIGGIQPKEILDFYGERTLPESIPQENKVQAISHFSSLFIFSTNGEIVAVGNCSEGINEFIFGSVAIVPGHDSVLCYDFDKRVGTEEYIR